MITREQRVLILCVVLGLVLEVSLLYWSEWLNTSFGRETKIPGYRGTHQSDSSTPVTRQELLHVSHRESTRSSNRIFSNSAFLKEPKLSRCAPKTNIVFLKIHKCGGSTLQNLLLRYGERRNLDFVLPEKANYLGLNVFHKGNMLYYPVKKYNILCHHTRFSYKEISQVMYKDSLYVTILRDPVTQFASFFSYYQRGKLYKLPADKALETFLTNPKHYYGVNSGKRFQTKNPMLYDLGLREKHLGDRLRTEEKIKLLEKEFDLVLILEHFDESLVLLRHLMCWEVDDVVYFVHNARKTSVKTVAQDLSEKIQHWNAGDLRLYRAFNRTLWRRIDAFGRAKMQREVGELRTRISYFQGRCKEQRNRTEARGVGKIGVNRSASFRFSEDDMCDRMTWRELPYTDYLRERQAHRYSMGNYKPIKSH